MMTNEKQELLTLFGEAKRWCQEAEARDAHGSPVCYSDEAATAWDLVGGMCRLFGWRRACQLFRQIHRHLNGPERPSLPRHDPEMVAMGALFDYNDATDTSYETMIMLLRELPVWRGTSDGPITSAAAAN